jgi:hypothetical protein
MSRRKATILVIIGGTVGLVEGALIFLNCPIPYPVLLGTFIIGFLCGAVGFVYAIKYMRDDLRNK